MIPLVQSEYVVGQEFLFLNLSFCELQVLDRSASSEADPPVSSTMYEMARQVTPLRTNSAQHVAEDHETNRSMGCWRCPGVALS
jgi:hypothetical protein